MIYKYRKKPVEIEAVEWDTTWKRFDKLREKWLGFSDAVSAYDVSASGKVVTYLRLKTLEGSLTVSDGDFIIKGVKGEFYPCKPDIFEMTYDLTGPLETNRRLCVVNKRLGTSNNL